MILIETERFSIRPMKIEDATSLFEIFSDPQVMKYWNTPPWQSSEQAIQFIENSRVQDGDTDSLTFGIYCKTTKSLNGKIMLFNIEQESKRAEIGFGIGRQYWGKGVIQEAARALIVYAFNTMNLRRIEAEIDPDNISSGKALERLGFVKEGVLRERWEINGVISDSAMYGLLARESKFVN